MAARLRCDIVLSRLPPAMRLQRHCGRGTSTAGDHSSVDTRSPAAASPNASALSPTQWQVLLIEDDVILGYAIVKAFQKAGMFVEHVTGVMEGLERLSAREYTAVLLDLIVPGPLNGFAIITYLETEKPEMVDRLYLISGVPEQTIMHAAPALLPRFYRKPFEIDNVIEAIRRQVFASNIVEPPGILIVDDNEDERRLIAQVARRLERNPHEACDGLEAIRMLAAEEFCALVVDLILPYVDGYGIIRYLRETKPLLLQRTIVVTAMPERYRSPALLKSVCSIVEKPADLEKLQAAIAGCMGCGPTGS